LSTAEITGDRGSPYPIEQGNVGRLEAGLERWECGICAKGLWKNWG